MVLAYDMNVRSSLFSDIKSASANSLLILATGAGGGAADEAHHWGLRMLIALCASGPIPFLSSIELQFQLLPGMIGAMFFAMVVTIGIHSTVPAGRRREAGHLGVTAAHIGCVAVMLISISVCASLLRISGDLLAGALLMLATDFVVGISIAIVSVMVLRWIQACAIRPSAVS